MPTLKPVRGALYIKWLHAGLYKDAASLECSSCENFLRERDIRDLMHKKWVGGFVITELTKPVGYTIYEQSGNTLEIVSLVIHPDYRRRGIATLLFERLKTRTRWQTMIVCVRESNLGAHLFLRDVGFLATDIKRRYFQDHYADCVEVEDAYQFELPRKEKT